VSFLSLSIRVPELNYHRFLRNPYLLTTRDYFLRMTLYNLCK